MSTTHYIAEGDVSDIEDGSLKSNENTRATIRAIAFQAVSILGGGVVVLWAAVTIAFLAIHLAPGDTAALLLGPENQNDPVLLAQANERWGLDRPLWVQYAGYLSGAIHGDLGESFVLKRPVTQVLGEQLWPTVQLAGLAFALALAFAAIGTLLTAGHPWRRSVSSSVELVLVSLPSFWIGIILLAVFSFSLGWFPVSGAGSFSALVLPALALAIPLGAYLTQVFREGTERSLEVPYSTTARSRGISDTGLRVHHSLRHGVLPVITLSGLVVGSLLGGAVITEQVFGRPGLGQVTVAAVHAKDVPVILGVAIVATAAFVIATTIADLLRLLVDPRIRQSTPRTSGSAS